MLRAEYIAPGKEVSFLVNRYAVLSAQGTGDHLDDRFIPDGLAGIVVHYSGQFTLVNEGQFRALPGLFLTKPVNSSLQIRVTPPVDSMIIICYASVFSKFFGIDMNFGSGVIYEPLRGPLLGVIQYELLKPAQPKSRISAFESFVKQINKSNPYHPDILDSIYLEILKSKGTEPIGELSSKYHMHPRTLRRNFHKRIGISPKDLAEIVRVHNIWSRVIENPDMDAFDAVCEGGFYDKPHFIRIFKKIVGETPYAFFQRNHEVATALSAKNPQYL
ncbi:MAG TPA: helix-turn-helix domain-containing protein [Bacteroidales bacterium]|nr:helix-turn-helix domain-containing protein [Bacteroidales bacterium]HRZ49692.1 helix-turn-helix domain-containing protein [Bacteroidales bacterium]